MLIPGKKIPIFIVNTFQMEEILFYRIKVSKELLSKIEGKTILEDGSINYCFLVTNREKVIALNFNSNGELIEKSNLLLDEEEAVISEISDFNIEYLDYEVFDYSNSISFLTRYERSIKRYLLDEINGLFMDKKYDEINYLYYEIFNNECSINKKYKLLVDSIKNNFNDNYFELYRVIKLTKQSI